MTFFVAFSHFEFSGVSGHVDLLPLTNPVIVSQASSGDPQLTP